MKAMAAKQRQSMMNRTLKLTALLTLSALSFSAFAEVNSGTGLPQDTNLLDAMLEWMLGLLP